MAEQPIDASSPPTGGTILVVDDQTFNLTVARIVLEQRGYRVLTATGGQAALELAAAHMPRAILLDLLMPVCNGYDVLAGLRDNPRLARIPVIILSSFDDEDTVAAVRRAGAIAHLSKPLSIELLTRELTALRLFPTR